MMLAGKGRKHIKMIKMKKRSRKLRLSHFKSQTNLKISYTFTYEVKFTP